MYVSFVWMKCELANQEKASKIGTPEEESNKKLGYPRPKFPPLKDHQL